MLRARFLPLAALACALASCSSTQAPATATATADAAVPLACPEGFARETASAPCAAVVPAEDCAPGTAPFLGDRACAPVGHTCGAGLSRDPSGWGCVDSTPISPCDGATREAYGSAVCVPVGDCTAPAPDAALFVDASFTDAQLDATHARTLDAAVKTAPAGAVISVAPGAYAESIEITRPVTIAGRCAAKVEIAPPPLGTAPGLRVRAKGVIARGLTLRGHAIGVSVEGGGALVLEDAVVAAARGAGVYVDGSSAVVRRVKIAETALDAAGKWGWGIAAGGKSTLEVEGATVIGGTDGVFVASSGTVATLRDVVIARQAPSGSSRSSGVRVTQAGKVVLTRAIVRDVVGDASVAADGGTAVVEDSVLRGSRVRAPLARGHGVIAFVGGSAKVARTTISDHESVGVIAQNAKSHVDLSDVVILGPKTSAQAPDAELRVANEKSGIGVQITDSAELAVQGSVVWGAQGYGMYLSDAVLDVKRTFIDGTRTISAPGISYACGIVASGGRATIDHLSIAHAVLAGIEVGRTGTLTGTALFVRDTTEATPTGTGAGFSVGEGGSIDLSNSAIDRATGVGVLAVRGGGAEIKLARSTVTRTRAAPSFGFGHGVILGDETTVTLEDTHVTDSAFIGLAAAGGRARVTRGTFQRNRVAVHVQNGSFLVESASASDLGAAEVRVSKDTTFTDNETKLGSGELPLPKAVLR